MFENVYRHKHVFHYIRHEGTFRRFNALGDELNQTQETNDERTIAPSQQPPMNSHSILLNFQQLIFKIYYLRISLTIINIDKCENKK